MKILHCPQFSLLVFASLLLLIVAGCARTKNQVQVQLAAIFTALKTQHYAIKPGWDKYALGKDVKG